VILDSSAVISILLKQPGFDDVLRKLIAADAAGIGTPTLAETAIVLRARLGIDPRAMMERFLQEFGITAIPFGDDHGERRSRLSGCTAKESTRLP